MQHNSTPHVRAEEVAGLKVELFGELRAWRGEELVGSEEWGGQKPRSLLKLLLTRPGHAFSREEIIEALWPGVSPKAADRRLRITVSLLRRALEPDLKRGLDSRYIISKRPGYLFDRQPDCEVDAWEFEKHQENADAARKAEKFDEAVREYRAALQLLRGEFLAEDPYEDWAMKARGKWRERHLSVLLGLSECLAVQGRYTEAVKACDQALALDEYREELHRRLMFYHYCAGEQALALQAYRRYAKTLKEELDAAPSPELARLKERMEALDVPGVDEVRRYPRPRRPLRFPYSLSRTRFVGRDGEYAWLIERLREAMGSKGGAVAVEGEAGVGKTRLAQEFLGYSRSHGARVLSGRCYERELGPPLEPVVEALDPLPTVEETVVARPGFVLGYRQEAGPRESAHVYRTLAREIIQESHRDGHGLLILFVDDVQWADAATLEFLSYLAKRISRERVLLLFTYRREQAPELTGWLDHLAERRVVDTLSLNRLSQEDTEELVRSMSSRTFGKLPPLANFLWQESEGNPFYAVEYLRWLIESGIVEIDSRRRISGLKGEALRGSTLPSGVYSLIQARLRGLDKRARDLIELAAVVGRIFDLGLLCKAAARGEAEVFSVIRPLMASGLIVETLEEAYYFSHDKLRQTLYEGISAPRRRELHLQVVKALEDGGEPAELAHHYLRAGAWRPALENLVLTARKAEESDALETALGVYARALKVVERLPESGEDRLELLAGRERLLERMDHREKRAEAAHEMFELAKRLGDRRRIAEVHIRRMGALAALSDLTGAEGAARAAIAIFQELDDPSGEARVHREAGYVCWMRRDYAGALGANFRVLSIHRKMGDRSGEAGDALNIAQIYRSMKDYEQSLHWAEEATRISREIGDEFKEALGIDSMAITYQDRGELEAALPLNLKILRFFAELGSKRYMHSQHTSCGTLYLRLGAPDKALDHYQAAARLSQEVGFTRDEGCSLVGVGVCLEQTGNLTGAADAYRRAIQLLDTAYELSGTPEELSRKAEALTLLGRLLHRSLDKPAEALAAYEIAAGIYRDLDDTHRLRELLLNLGGLRWRMGRLEDSARGYKQALKLAREHRETADEATALASLSVIHRDLGSLKESLRCGREALSLLQGSLEDLQAEAYVLSSLAESHRRLQHYPSALSCLRRSLRLRRKIGDRKGEVGVLHDLATVYENMEDTGPKLLRKSRKE